MTMIMPRATTLMRPLTRVNFAKGHGDDKSLAEGKDNNKYADGDNDKNY
jgi:hypothetical protein